MSTRKKYTDWHHARIKAEYRRTSSCERAAEYVGCSQSYAWRVCKEAGLIEADVVEHSIGLLKEARRLYAEEEMSCRAVSRKLRERHGPLAPSQQWVYQQMQRLGLIRSKSETNRIWQQRANRIDYSAAEEEAYRLFTEHAWSRNRIAEHLGVGRTTVGRWLHEEVEDLPSLSEATIRAYWDADTPEVRARWKRALAVFRMRTDQGLSYQQIHERTGYATATIQRYLEAVRTGRPTFYSKSRKSRYRGVSWRRQARRWIAELMHDGRRYRLGSFESEIEAAEAYDAACLERGLTNRLNLKESMLT